MARINKEQMKDKIAEFFMSEILGSTGNIEILNQLAKYPMTRQTGTCGINLTPLAHLRIDQWLASFTPACQEVFWQEVERAGDKSLIGIGHNGAKVEYGYLLRQYRNRTGREEEQPRITGALKMSQLG